MSPDEFLAEAERRLAGAKYRVERVALRGVPAMVARRKPFRPQWMMTQLKTTVVVCAVDGVTQPGWRAFVDDATAVARDFPGGLPNGLQSGYGAVPVLAGTHVDPHAIAFATDPPHVEWFGGIALPGLVDLSTGQSYGFDRNQLAGRVHLGFLRKQRALVTGIAARQEFR